MAKLSAGMHTPAVLLKAVGDGVAESSSFEALPKFLNRLDPTVLLRLVVASDSLGEAFVTSTNSRPSTWLKILLQVLEGADVEVRARVRRRFLSLLDDSVAAETVPLMLADVAGTELSDLAVEFAHRGKLCSQTFNAVFAQAVRNSGSVHAVRDAVASGVHLQGVDAFLVELVEFKHPDLEWLLRLDDDDLAGRLLTALLANADTKDLYSLLSKRGWAPRVVSALHAVLPTSASQLARILTLDFMRGGAGLDVGFEVVSMLQAEGRQSLEAWLLREVLSAGPLGGSRLAHALAECRVGLTPDELVAAATVSSIGPRRVSKNLEALNAAPHEVRDAVVGVVDLLSRNLVERRWEKLGGAAYSAWASMLADAATASPERRIKATTTAFGFALRHVSYPVSPLVVASFPTVYREFPNLRKLGLDSDLFPVSFYYWMNAKDPKDARHRLIDALVSAFFHSSWPPADLLIAALEADVAKRVVKRVRKRFSGSRYLESIVEDVKRLDDESRHRVLACLSD